LILSQPDLRKAVQQGDIASDPMLEDNQWGQASVDLRLGFSFTCLKDLPGVTFSIADGLPTLGASGFWQI
jgi:deoxycytidine triphosphate deaminase